MTPIGKSALLAIVLAVAAGCTTVSGESARTARRALEPAPTTVADPPTTTMPPPPCGDARASFAPSPLWSPGEMPVGSTMRDIQERGKLVVGVDENTPEFAARNAKGQIEGLEVDLVKAIANAIIGPSARVVFRTVVTAEKNQVVHDHLVDLTASADSMTCSRWNEVAFSTEYFTAYHKLMVRTDSTIEGMDDLAGKTVCVTAGSSSVKLLADKAPKAHALEVPARSDCLLAIQEGQADAYLGHDTFLRGMHAQDPLNTRILDQEISKQNYGIAIPNDHRDLVQFVNAVLENMRANGALADLYTKWHQVGSPPDPMYRDDTGAP